MRPRTEAVLALGALTLLALLVGLLAGSGQEEREKDQRPSTLLAGPEGARGLLEAVRALGISVRRFRQRPRELPALAEEGRQALVILAPSYSFSPPEREAVLAFSRGADVILAGERAEPLMRCFGYRVAQRLFDSVRVYRPGRAPAADAAWVRAELLATGAAVDVDSSRAFDVGRSACRVPPLASVERLLLSRGDKLVAVQLSRADVPHRILLFADDALFRNRSLRRSEAGPFLLGLFREGRYDRVIFEEYHHGFGPQGSLAGAVLGWTARSPWGWLIWQLAIVGLLALLASGVRFGPPLPGLARTRRSPLEHVRALATALAAAGGHDEAIGAMVRGLRRRLLPGGGRMRSGTQQDWRRWLEELARSAPDERVRTPLATLGALTVPGQPAASVLKAANAVEDVWQNLRR